MQNTIWRISVITAVVALAACSTQREAPVETVTPSEHKPHVQFSNKTVESSSKVMSDYAQYQPTLDALRAVGNDQAAINFLNQQTSDNAMAERVRNQWLKNLGARGQWSTFNAEYAKLDKGGIDQENQCYAQLSGADRNTQLAQNLILEHGKLPAGCNTLLQQSASGLNQNQVWSRIRGLLSNNQITDARNLAAAIGQPLPSALGSLNGSGMAAQESLLYSVTNANARKDNNIGNRIAAISGNLSREQAGFAYGAAGETHAKSQNFGVALQLFNQADRAQLDEEQWEWYVRSALRFSRWQEVNNIIAAMPAKLQNKEDWQYWRARALQAMGQSAQAQQLFQKASQSGRNFYALMALEALGGKVSTNSNAKPASEAEKARAAQDGAIARALTLYHASVANDNRTVRNIAQQQWRYAVRNLNEPSLLAAAAVAQKAGFNEMAIYAADRTNHLLDFNIRYMSPYKDITTRYARQVGIDPAWAYGLIRQESRFMIGARSHVGASGLMQLMPATAREVERKIGASSTGLDDIEHNIKLGTWYLADVRNSSGSETMATAGYNAGPGRARQWRANVPLEGAIYAETIPFNETRDYVKKVMANATYYASLFGEPRQSLTQRIGTVPAK
ncbi:lytic transglycosylase [Vitreoscilla sp. C1]|uniref:lytic transglycosylase domain-containing protein n=1 Tax=Vitreoscilla sp. (strain C1) TaxID=96942 RepID=UPI00148ED962|nr:lytic transglycosylase domain-containing protein [Vitreoscilla sp. C1]AUZ05444.2 lytic transglycosylase [Vitreoscilla sp. C1]